MKCQVHNKYISCSFHAMASPCELLVETHKKSKARKMAQLAKTEALRIEKKFSRYNEEGVVYRIHQNKGKTIKVDKETSLLLDFAQECYEMSDGLFDITSGILRKAWRFDGSDNIPESEKVNSLLNFVGWDKVTWKKPYFTLPKKMEIDFGGIGKEYAVDRIGNILSKEFADSFLINMGGDMLSPRPPQKFQSWSVGIESIEKSKTAAHVLQLRVGALATSGDARGYLLKDNKRYTHILNPKTGWPVENAPRSVTVAADTCTEAGILSTLASLQGSLAERFLENEGFQHWVFH